MDAISAIERRRERLTRSKKSEHLTLLDFSKAFDRVTPNAIDRALVEAGLDDDTRLHVLDAIDGSVLMIDGAAFYPLNGTKQGCVLSPMLFTMVLAMITRTLPCAHFEYADDLAIVTQSADEANDIVRQIATAGKPLGLTLNLAKTEHVTLGRDGQPFDYLGAQLCDPRKHLATRVSRAEAAYACLYTRLFRRSLDVDIKTKLSIFQSMVDSVLCYGIHAVAHSRVRLRKALDWFVLRKTKAIMSIDATAHVSYDEMKGMIREHVSFEWPSEKICKRQARLIGHVLRADPDQLNPLPGVRLGRGRPPNDLASVVTSNIRDSGLAVKRKELAELAADRASWKLLTN